MASSKNASARKPAEGAAAPWLNASMLGAALSYGLATLYARGRVEWPPTQLMASTFTVAGCVALTGPFLLGRRGAGSGAPSVGLGDLIWLAGGLVIWTFDLAALARGEARSMAWATPLGYQPMGLTILAVALAAWRFRIAGASWSWTNVVGWALGLIWVGLAASTLVPARSLGLASR